MTQIAAHYMLQQPWIDLLTTLILGHKRGEDPGLSSGQNKTDPQFLFVKVFRRLPDPADHLSIPRSPSVLGYAGAEAVPPN